MRASYVGIIAGIAIVASILGTSSWYNIAQATILAGSPNLQIETSLVCMVNSPDKMDGWFTVFVSANREVSAVGTATAQLYLVAKYLPHKPDGSHLPVTTSTLIIDTQRVSSPGPDPITAIASGQGSVTVPAHENTDHINRLLIYDFVGTTEVEVAQVPIPSCEP